MPASKPCAPARFNPLKDDARLTHHRPCPAQLRNLIPYLTPWLEGLGFTAEETVEDTGTTLLSATWPHERAQEVFTLRYVHHQDAGGPLALVSLAVHRDGQGSQCLVAATHVTKTSDVRLLLLGNHRYQQARRAALAAGVLLPVAQQKKFVA